MTFAIIETGGKQYKVSEGSRIKVEKLEQKVSDIFKFDKVLLKADKGEVLIGQPYLKGSSVEAKVLGQGRGVRKMVFRYHSKTRYHKKKTHREPFTEAKVLKIIDKS